MHSDVFRDEKIDNVTMWWVCNLNKFQMRIFDIFSPVGKLPSSLRFFYDSTRMNAKQQDVKLANENNIADRSIFHRLINYMVKRTQNKSVNGECEIAVECESSLAPQRFVIFHLMSSHACWWSKISTLTTFFLFCCCVWQSFYDLFIHSRPDLTTYNFLTTKKFQIHTHNIFCVKIFSNARHHQVNAATALS